MQPPKMLQILPGTILMKNLKLKSKIDQVTFTTLQIPSDDDLPMQ